LFISFAFCRESAHMQLRRLGLMRDIALGLSMLDFVAS
jgi:hypothetical protein